MATTGARWAARGLIAAGVVTACVAVFHAVAIVAPGISEPSPAWRHGVFVLVNLFFAWAFLARARWLPWPFAVLCVQQTWSHGRDLVAAHANVHLDVQSLAVLVSLPVLCLLVVLGRTPPVPAK